MRSLYNSVLLPLRLPLAVLAAWKSRDPQARLEWQQRRGVGLPEGSPRGVWLHGASVGEVQLVRAIAARLRDRRPALPLSGSALTNSGHGQLPSSPELDRSFYLPLDFLPFVRAGLDAINPAALTLVETELWPNLLHEAATRDCRITIVNARLSEERMRRYRRLRRLYAPGLQGVHHIGAQSNRDAERFCELGACSKRVTVSGNIKYDLPLPADTRRDWQKRLRISDTDMVWVAGSTAEGEEELLLPVYAALRGEHRDLRWIVAPRHPERASAVTRTIRSAGWTVFELSRLGPDVMPPEFDVLVVDRVGALRELYRLGDVAFVGGSLAPIGGHNLLEPASVGVPVAFGPHVGHVEAMAQTLLRASGGYQVNDAQELARLLGRWLRQPEERLAIARRGQGVIDGNRGALTTTIDLILDSLVEAA